ncbi:aminotransferase class I/II-fold pyridoxal phosphate-dependent enzyme [Pseudomonas sp. F16(2018)]|uniref:aminotransferase class I/II-fold pyridoxal phosphate-dependent enzyme n=1 Tax=Pseudomonas sp. F16(2018) TaxID=2093746 RepID=UPI001117BC49
MFDMAVARNRYTNYRSMIQRSETDWQTSYAKHLSGLQVQVIARNLLQDQHGRTLQHFCTTSYLGLDYHPDILQGAIEELENSRTLRIANSRNRCQFQVLDQYEAELSDLFGCESLATLSCSAASSGVLPLVAAGIFTNGVSPHMVFDKFAHYSLNHVKAACADETEIQTLPHDDMDQLESICRQHGRVAYITDGYYSMGGTAHMDALLYLKERYGLFLYLDDSHALSTAGVSGQGFVRGQLQELDEGIIIVASLGKAFAASGGLLMLANTRQKRLVQRYGGPTNWSQSLNAAAIGAGRASARLHSSPLLNTLQQQLKNNVELFDKLLPTPHAGSASPIRLIPLGEAEYAIAASTFLANNGFLTSAVFFPVVPKDAAALRVTLRADMQPGEVESFCRGVAEYLNSNPVVAPLLNTQP